MASLIAGYEYDIFISYRQKDNKGDRWVSEFVEALKTELESTFKEEISVYFDINPHDGLLETHDVDASLKDKLKCLVFIPIISRTYCDPKSFAWEHEFKAFIEQASKDQYGLKVKLPNGNVASRILPIQIHDLYPEDKAILEKELGGVLRAIEFIYKEPGINKPLTNDDDEKKNLNNTKYRLQVNKMANAIDEIINSLKERQTFTVERKSSYQHDHGTEKDKIKEVSASVIATKRSKKWLFTILVTILTITGLFGIFKIIETRKQANEISKLEKSIAILPFINDSPDKENEYFCNGMMDEILNNLQRIKDFRVLSRTSTEQYRSAARPPIFEIAKKLDVNYIVEGSVQKYGNTFRLRVQLIAANNEKHMWGESYEQEIKETKDIFKIQSQIAQTIAEELSATITPEEKHIIEKTPTANLTAYVFYQRGKDELAKYPYPQFNRESIQKAEILFQSALEYDSSYAQAYTGLAEILWNKVDRDYTITDRTIKNRLTDSILSLVNIALSYDNQLSDAYFVRGGYYLIKSSSKRAIEELNKALRYNPNYGKAYSLIAGIYEELDLVKALENFKKAAYLEHGPVLTTYLKRIGYNLFWAGFPEHGKTYLLEALKLDRDSVYYFNDIFRLNADTKGEYEQAVEYFGKRYMIDSSNTSTLIRLGYYNSLSGHYKESLKYYEKSISISKSQGQSLPALTRFTHIGFAYMQNGFRKEAEDYFEKQITAYKNRLIAIPAGMKIYWAYPLAGVYASKGDKEKAYENLKIFGQNPSYNLSWVTLLKNDPQFNSIRNEPEFQKIVRNVESKYRTEHERVKRWLEEQEKL